MFTEIVGGHDGKVLELIYLNLFTDTNLYNFIELHEAARSMHQIKSVDTCKRKRKVLSAPTQLLLFNIGGDQQQRLSTWIIQDSYYY